MTDELHILHVDMDAFYASVEQRDFPELRGKAIAVGGSATGRGVVSAASYEARTFGVRSAMPCREAARRCPHLIFRPVRMKEYSAVSRQIRTIFESVTPEMEVISIDEAFLDVSGVLHFGSTAVELAEQIRERIRSELQLTASVGVATNKFLAKVASDQNKPDGLTVVPVSEAGIRDFLAPLPVRRLWGCGAKTEARLKLEGIRTVQQVQDITQEALAGILGHRQAEHLKRLAFGVDSRQVVQKERDKSISSEHTFHQDIFDRDEVHRVILRQSEEVGRRLRKHGLWANTVQLKIRYAPFETRTRQQSLSASTRSDADLIRVAQELFDLHAESRPIRLIGVGVSKLTEEARKQDGGQLDLFAEASASEAEPAIDGVVDELRQKFGQAAVMRGITPRQSNRGRPGADGKS